MSAAASTRVFALLGDPVSHSLSPLMQNAAFAAAAVDGIYVALRCGAADLHGLVAGLARSGGGGNITIPHKLAAAAALDRPMDAVRKTGACNTFWSENGRICGDNTDVAGVHAAANALLGSVAGARALIVGAGGAARAAAVALMDIGADLALLNRSPVRAESLAREVAAGGAIRILREADLGREEFDLVINATPLGIASGDPLPLELGRLCRAGAVLDLVYRPGGTRWTQHARQLGVPSADGLEMLLAQGAAAFALWWARPAPVTAMRTALHRAAGIVPPAHGAAPRPRQS